jgi:signal transduction histidine kinase
VPGLGLGLHVVHGIVAAMGGHLSIDSSPGRGAAVRVVWPRNASQGAAVGLTPEAWGTRM